MKKGYIFWLVPVAALVWASCKDKNAAQNAAPPATPVSVAEAKTARAVYYDQYQATVVSLNTVELRSEIPGFITGIFFKEGDVVPEGKKLYEIDQRKYQAAYDQAIANLSGANAFLVPGRKKTLTAIICYLKMMPLHARLLTRPLLRINQAKARLK